jgi:hypothetical protein
MPARPARPPARRPSIDDYLTPEEQARLARVLVGVLISAAEERAKGEAARARTDVADDPHTEAAP